MSKRLVLMILLLAAMLLVAIPAQAQSGDDAPVVYAVFFWSPTCPHCHTVIDEVFPVMDEEFGDQFQVIGIDVSAQGAGFYYQQACDQYGIPENSCGSVPLLVIGESEWMMGSVEIPDRAPGLVREGLANGGIPVPEFIRADYEAAVAEQDAASAGSTGADAADTTGEESTAAAESESAAGIGEIDASSSVADRLAADPLANAVAIGVLVALVLSAVGVIVLGRSGQLQTSKLPRLGAQVAVIFGLVMGLTLIAGDESEGLATVAAYTVVIGLVIASYFLTLPPTRRDMRPFALPLVLVVGLLVSIYLAQVETGDTAAVCGAVGDCNTVQQSEYASLFGVLPVGVLGVFGYVAMLLMWGVSLMNGGNSGAAPLAKAALFWMSLVGVLFSAYLTFLEPFVIGATCAWCITSALTMMAALWLTAPDGWQAATQVIADDGDSPVGAGA